MQKCFHSFIQFWTSCCYFFFSLQFECIRCWSLLSKVRTMIYAHCHSVPMVYERSFIIQQQAKLINLRVLYYKFNFRTFSLLCVWLLIVCAFHSDSSIIDYISHCCNSLYVWQEQIHNYTHTHIWNALITHNWSNAMNYGPNDWLSRSTIIQALLSHYVRFEICVTSNDYIIYTNYIERFLSRI